MDPVSGVTRRTLVKTARRATERFRVDFEHSVGRELDPGEVVLSEYSFSQVPPLEPFVVYSRQLHLAQAVVLSSRVEPRPAHVAPAVDPPERIDASSAKLLDDWEFWPIVDVMEGRAWENSLARAVRLLAEHSEEFILSFAQTMSHKALQLDHPDNYARQIDDDGEVSIAEGRYGDSQFGSVMVGGRARYEAVLGSPGSIDPNWGSDHSFAVMHFAAEAFQRRTGRTVFITTSWDGRVGHNAKNWVDAGIALRPPVRSVRATDAQSAAQAEVAAKQAKYLEESGIHPDFSPFSNDRKTWYVVRYFVQLDDHALEQVAMHPAPVGLGPSIDREVAEALALRAGGSLMGEARGYATMISKLFSTSVFEQKVASSLPFEQHVQKWIDGL